jgi:SAM-dependent methyltransferase
MIALAAAQEEAEPLGIAYRVEDVKRLALLERFDRVVAAYLLNYARTREELAQMCRSIACLLKPGGRFVTVNNNPDEPPEHFASGRAYGYDKRLRGELKEGAPIVWEFFLPDGPIEVTNYYLSRGVMEDALRSAGLSAVRWHAPEVSPEGVSEYGREFWASFLEQPPVTLIECVK